MCETHAKLTGKVAIVTGGSSGIGLETAKDLAYRGAKVIIASRNETKLKTARQEIEATTGNPNISYNVLDLGSLASVRNFAREVATENRLDILINNAGAVGLPNIRTADDLNLTMQVNFFGTFLLTYLLLPLLKSSGPSRIINGSGATKYIGQIDLDKWNEVGQSAITTVANSQLAIVLHTAELDRRLKGTGVTANGFDPFLTRDTDIFRNIDGVFKTFINLAVNLLGQRKEVVGRQIGYLASAPELQNTSGVLYVFCRPWWNHLSVNNEELTKKMWERAKKLVKITPEEDWETESNEV